MKMFGKIVAALVLLVIVAGVGGYIYLNTAYPNVPSALEISIDSTPEKIERGRYLAHNVAVCMDCHSTRDWNAFAGPLVTGTEGKGGEVFPEEAGFPGTLYAPNITPAGIGHWTDGELIRAFTTGVNREGRPLFPLMPYPNYAKLSTEDVHAIVAYIRSLAPIENKVPLTKLNFPLNLIVRTMPAPADPQPKPNPADTVAYGKYLITVASCGDCHTPMEKGEPLPGMNYAGGFEFRIPNGVVYSANITPDVETGIGTWSKSKFINRFKQYADSSYQSPVVSINEFNTIMPWTMYAGMSEEDLGAIYAYLKTVSPVKNKVIGFQSDPNPSLFSVRE